ncbi:MAG: hypothetical protein O2924_03330 [Chloroflexi bacterium]|nr:hypothetical protein [Chloroflexota bacterium]
MHSRLGRRSATGGPGFASTILVLILLVLVMLAFLVLPPAAGGVGFESGVPDVVAALRGVNGTGVSPVCCRM